MLPRRWLRGWCSAPELATSNASQPCPGAHMIAPRGRQPRALLAMRVSDTVGRTGSAGRAARPPGAGRSTPPVFSARPGRSATPVFPGRSARPSLPGRTDGTVGSARPGGADQPGSPRRSGWACRSRRTRWPGGTDLLLNADTNEVLANPVPDQAADHATCKSADGRGADKRNCRSAAKRQFVRRTV